MDGIFVAHNQRAKSKAALRRALLDDVARHAVVLEATSLHGDGLNRMVAELPNGSYPVVGPDPYRDRRWYGTIVISDPPDPRNPGRVFKVN